MHDLGHAPQARSHDPDTLARLHGVPLRRRAVRDARFASPQLPLKRQAPSRSHNRTTSLAATPSTRAGNGFRGRFCKFFDLVATPPIHEMFRPGFSPRLKSARTTVTNQRTPRPGKTLAARATKSKNLQARVVFPFRVRNRPSARDHEGETQARTTAQRARELVRFFAQPPFPYRQRLRAVPASLSSTPSLNSRFSVTRTLA